MKVTGTQLAIGAGLGLALLLAFGGGVATKAGEKLAEDAAGAVEKKVGSQWKAQKRQIQREAAAVGEAGAEAVANSFLPGSGQLVRRLFPKAP